MGGKYKDLEKRREKARRFYRNHREEMLAKARKYRKENREKVRRWCLNWKKKKYNEAIALIGDKCFFCAHKRIVFHEKNGVRHSGTNTAFLVTKNPENFVSLCFPHHQAVHFCMEFLNMSWNTIVRRFKNGR